LCVPDFQVFVEGSQAVEHGSLENVTFLGLQ